MHDLGTFLFAAGLTTIVAATCRYGWRLTIADFFADALLSAGEFLWRLWPWGALLAAGAVIVAWRLWRRRKRRGRAPRSYGAKSRALLATLARKAREAAKPRPALQPVPGGAR
jgi:hypothetical protein